MDASSDVRGSFGQPINPGWRERADEAGEFEAPVSDGPELLSDALPAEVADEMANWTYAVAMDAGVIYEHLPGGAAQYILTGAVNDVLALVGHVDRFDGRSAAHAARVLFEHLVNFYDVLDSSTNTSDRYIDHQFVTANQVAARRWYLDLLDKRAAKRERNRLDGLAARTQRPLAAAIAKYGRNFRRSWAEGTLRERAIAHNLGDQYDGYRILSSVIHGSSGAMAGIVKPVDGSPVHRIGGDMDLAATAYAEGLASFYAFAERLKQEVPGSEADEIHVRTGNLLLHLQTVRETLARVDKRTWPKVMGPPTMTVAAIWPDGTVRWYLHDLRDNSMVLADLIDPAPDLSAVMERAAHYDPAAFGGRPLTVACAGTRATPRPGSTRVPATSILVPQGHPAAEHKPRRIW